MKTKIKLILAAAVAALMIQIAPVSAQSSKGKVLVVMSGGHILTLGDGKAYATGFYLNEVAVPAQALVTAGYTLVFASPNGDTPSMDASSNVDKFFGGDASKRMKALRFIDGLPGIHHPRLLSSIVGHTQDYVAIFVPGGHAPMIDLVKDKNLGLILRDFHKTGRPTALICHGPMGLLSTIPETEKYNKELVAGHFQALGKLAHGFPYAGYKVAVFSKAEEKMIEGPQLGGPAPYYNDEALTAAGLKVENNTPWQPKVVQDRELITGQQPFSDHAFADALIAKLAALHR